MFEPIPFFGKGEDYSSTGRNKQNIMHKKGKGDAKKRSQQQEWNESILSAYSYPPSLVKLKGNVQADHQLIQMQSLKCKE